MKDFLGAALPWVFMGAAVAIICVNLARKQTKKDKKLAEAMAVGLGLGLIFGVALNFCGLWGNHFFGLAAGPLWGMALATIYAGHDKPTEGK